MTTRHPISHFIIFLFWVHLDLIDYSFIILKKKLAFFSSPIVVEEP